MENSLGHKIQYYRKRMGFSQLELEILIDAAQGSISRIENNNVRPTKETLSKLSTALKLKPSEVADILDLKLFSTQELILAIQAFSSSLDLNTTLQTAVDIMFDLFPNYNGGIIFLREDNKEDVLYAKTISSQIPNLNKFLKLLPFELSDIEVNLNKYNNFATETVRLKKSFQSSKLVDFGKGVVADPIIESIQLISGFKNGITLPMINENEVIGITFFTKRSKDIFSGDEIKLLELLTNQITISIINSKKFEELKKELNLIKSLNGKE